MNILYRLGDIFWMFFLSKLEALALISVGYKYGYPIVAMQLKVRNNIADGNLHFKIKPSKQVLNEIDSLINDFYCHTLFYRFFLCIGTITINYTIYIFNLIKGVFK